MSIFTLEPSGLTTIALRRPRPRTSSIAGESISLRRFRRSSPIFSALSARCSSRRTCDTFPVWVWTRIWTVCEHTKPDSLDLRLFPSVVLAVSFALWVLTHKIWFPRFATVPFRSVSCRACCDYARSIFSVTGDVSQIPSAVCRRGLCSRCPGVERCLSGVNIIITKFSHSVLLLFFVRFNYFLHWAHLLCELTCQPRRCQSEFAFG